jgi:hypothetical protein
MGFPGGHLTSRYLVCLFVICLFTGLLWLFLCMCVCVAVNYEWTRFLVCVSRTVSETKRNTNRTAPVSATLYTSMHMHIIYPVKGTWVSGVYRIRPLQKSLSCLLGFQTLTRNLTAGAFYRSGRRHRRHVIRLLTLFSFLSFFLSLSLIYAKLARTQVSLSSPVGEKIK